MPQIPKRHKAEIMVWTDLSVCAVDCLNESTTSDHVKQVLANIFMLEQYNTNLTAGIIMDLYFNAIQFARKENFSKDKTSAFFSIMKSIFEMCIETPFDNLDYTKEYFKDLLRCHSINCPPFSIPIFTHVNIMRISQYTTNTFFRHFDMYKYAFTPLIELDLKLNYIGMPSSQQSLEEVPDVSETDENVTNIVASRHETTIASDRIVTIDAGFKNEVKDFLSEEVKRIEENISQHMKAAADALQTRLTQLVTHQPGETSKEKN